MDGELTQTCLIFVFNALTLDTGFFSIQVLQKALSVFDIELIPIASQHQVAQRARADPHSIQAYICNLREHWLTIRRFGSQYFDLNSISTVPKFISNTYLSLYLAQLQQSGYSIFVIHGDLPPCTADERLSSQPIDPTHYRTLTERLDVKSSRTPQETTSSSSSSFDDREIQRALKASVEFDTAQDRALQKVLAQSLQDGPTVDETEQLNQKLLNDAIAASLVAGESNDSATAEIKLPKEPSIEGNLESLLTNSRAHVHCL